MVNFFLKSIITIFAVILVFFIFNQASASVIKMEQIWDSSGDDQGGAYFGSSVAQAGDVNGDGFDDVIISASTYNTSHQGAGKAYLYLGSASGLSATPSWTSSGSDEEYAYYGSSVVSAGDINHDGYNDVIVSQTYSLGNMKPGKVYLYLGGAQGLNSTPAQILSEGTSGADYGRSISSAGDINGDGFSDVIIGSPGDSVSHGLAGRAYLYLGSSSGLSLAWTSSGDDEGWAMYGSAVALAGDVNNDGFGDVIASALYSTSYNPKPGKVYLYLGSSSGLATTPAWTSADGIYGGFSGSSYYGAGISSVGDVNSDGFDDVIVRAHDYDSSENDQVGRAYLYLGNATGLEATASWQVSGYEQAGARYGSSLSFGDINGDGFSDVGIGALTYDTLTIPNAGVVYLYLGSKNGLSTNSSWTFFGNKTNPSGSISSAGDVNGDGYQDAAVSDSGFDTTNENAGMVTVYTNEASFSVSINSGAEYTISRKVDIALSAITESDPYQMIISEKSSFSGAVWENFSASKSFKLSRREGKKTIYAKFRDADGIESKRISDTIRYIKKPKFVTKSAKKKNEVLIKKKNEKYFASDFNFLFKTFPKKLKKTKYYLEIKKFKKYPKNYASAKKFSLKKYWKIQTNLNKYKVSAKKEKFKVKLIFKYTNKEWKALKKKNPSTSSLGKLETSLPSGLSLRVEDGAGKALKESDLVLKYYQSDTKTWKKLTAAHSLKKNTFTITVSDFNFQNNSFVIAKK